MGVMIFLIIILSAVVGSPSSLSPLIETNGAAPPSRVGTVTSSANLFVNCKTGKSPMQISGPDKNSGQSRSGLSVFGARANNRADKHPHSSSLFGAQHSGKSADAPLVIEGENSDPIIGVGTFLQAYNVAC